MTRQKYDTEYLAVTKGMQTWPAWLLFTSQMHDMMTNVVSPAPGKREHNTSSSCNLLGFLFKNMKMCYHIEGLCV